MHVAIMHSFDKEGGRINRELVISPDTSAAEEPQKLLPDSKVIKASNTTFAADFSSPVIDRKRAAERDIANI